MHTSPSSIHNACSKTVAQYRSLAACNTNIFLTCVQQKTESRLIADNSIISTLSYLTTLAATTQLENPPAAFIQNLSLCLHPAPKKCIDLVNHANNNLLIFNAQPALTTSTVNTTIFLFRGVATKKQGRYLCENASTGNNQSIYI